MIERITSDKGRLKQEKLFRLQGAPLVLAIAACHVMVFGCQRQESDSVPISPPNQTSHDSADRDQSKSNRGLTPSNTGGTSATSSGESATSSGESATSSGESTAPSGESADIGGKSEETTSSFNAEPLPSASGKDQPSVAQLREAALQALGEGQDDLAFGFARQAMRIEPDNPQVVFLFAMVLGDRHRYAEAIDLLQELSAREPKTRLPALGQTAEWMVESGRYDEAESQFRRVLQEIPDALMVHHRLGQLLLQTGRRTEAALHFDYLSQFGELDHEELRSLLVRTQGFPGDDGVTRFDPLNNLAMCRQELADGKADHVVEVITAAGDKCSAAEKALLVRLLAEQGKWAEAHAWLDKLDMETAGADAWYARGCLALNEVELKLAVACFCQAILLDQTDVDAYRMLSRALQKAGDPKVAKSVASRAMLIEETRRLGTELAGDQAKDLQLIQQLAQSLMKLNRPMEAFGWQTIGLVHAVEAAAITEGQAQATFEAIGRQREQLVNSGKYRLDPEFVLCGLGADVLDPIAKQTAN